MFGLFKSQQSYTVHERPDPPVDRDDRAEQLKFVKDGFSIFAFILPPVWMLANRLWLVLIGYIVLVAAIYAVTQMTGAPDHWRSYAMLALSLLIGFEADSLIRWTLDRRNWRFVGTVSGDNFDACERRFFDGWVQSVGIITPSNLDAPGNFEATTVPPVPKPRDGDLIPPKRRGWQASGPWTSWKRS